MNKIIQELKNQGFIAKEEIGFDQIAKYVERAHKDLKVAKANINIDTEAAYNYAYLAMLRTGRALMFLSGFRPIDGQQHKTVVLFSEAVLGKKFSVLTLKFNKMRKLRNRFTYDEPGILVSSQETRKALDNAKKFVEKATDLIQKKNPQRRLF